MQRYLKIVISFLLVISIGLTNIGFNAFAAETDEWRIIEPKSTIDVSKKWTVSFSSEVDTTSVVENDNVYVENQIGDRISIMTNVIDKRVEVVPVHPYEAGQSYTLYLESSILSKSKQSLKNTKFTFDVLAAEEITTFTKSGTYGGTASNVKTYAKDVVIESDGVTLEHAIIKGKLIISEKVKEGEVTLSNVQVEGDTEIYGGGPNSVYFNDSVLMTVIVNKNNGSIRVVAQGSTAVKEVLLESAAVLEEIGTVESEGFTHVEVTEGVRNSAGEVKLSGTFDTVNVRATGVQISLTENTSLDELVLSAIATIKGAGLINRLNVTSNGNNSSIEQRPQSVVLDISGHVNIAGEEVTESYSTIDQTSIQSIEAAMSYIRVDLTEQKVDLTKEDFIVTADVNGQQVELQHVNYLPNQQMFTYKPMTLTGSNIGETVTVTVAPNPASTKVIGDEKKGSFLLETGFSGRITDIFGNGLANMTVAFEDSYVRAVTDRNGYYSISAYPGVHYGTVSGPGFVKTNIVGTVSDYSFTDGINETAIRAASTNEMKIMLSWNDKESDVDSHLASENFHVYYANKTHGEYTNGNYYEYVDLDWDDTYYYGPETTTIRKWQDGRYIFFLHNYSGQRPLHESESKVEIFKGNSTTPDFTFNVPTDTGNARYWGVFELFVSHNGQVIDVKELNVTAQDEQWLIRPNEALQNAITESENFLEYSVDESVNSQLKAILPSAKAVLANANATTKQVIEQLKRINEANPYQNSYGFGPLQFYQEEYESYMKNVNEKITVSGYVKNREYNWFADDEIVTLKLDVTKLDFATWEYNSLNNHPLKFVNKRTGEISEIRTNGSTSVVLAQDTFANILQQFGPGFTIETQFPEVGEYAIQMNLVGEYDWSDVSKYVLVQSYE